MKKDEAAARREKLLEGLNGSLVALGHAPLVDDGKLYHEEIEGENRWAQRLSRPDRWPHVPIGPGGRAMPGLRYEVWFFQKRAEAWIALLCGRQGPAGTLVRALEPRWKEWLESGKYARRYRPLDAVWRKSYPDTDGIWRSLPLDDKLDKGLLTLVRDTLPLLEKTLEAADPEGKLASAQQEANAARDPLAELKVKFNTRLG